MKFRVADFIFGMGMLILLPQWSNAQWVQTNGPFTAVFSLAVSGNNIFAGTNQGVFLSTDSGTNWTAVNAGLTNTIVRSLAVNGNNIFVGTYGGGIFLSKDSGTSWTAVNSGPTDSIVMSLAVSGGNIFAGTWGDTGGGGVFLSKDAGESWSATGLMNAVVRSLAVKSGIVFAATSKGIYLSKDTGASWTDSYVGLSFGPVYSFAVSGNNIFAGQWGSGVFLSTNDGTSWTAIHSGMTDTLVTSLAISGNNIFAGTWGGGVFLSKDTGTSWTAINSGLTDTTVPSLVVNGNYIFAGTWWGSGVFRRPLSDFASIRNHRNSFSDQSCFRLNFRNLSRASMEISFSIPHSEYVTLDVYDRSGRKITTLIDKHLGAGMHSFSWDTRNVASSCYMVRMQAGANAQVTTIPLFR